MREVMTISGIDDKYIYLATITDEATCSGCALAGSCSVKGRDMRVRVKREDITKPVALGDTVIVELKYNVAILSLIVYGIPLAGFLVGVLIGYIFKWNDIVSLVTGLVFASCGFLISKIFDKKYEVKIIDVKKNDDNYLRNLAENGKIDSGVR